MRGLCETSFMIITDDEKDRFNAQYLEWLKKKVPDLEPLRGKYVMCNSPDHTAYETLEQLMEDAKQKGLKYPHIAKVPSNLYQPEG